MPYQSTEKTRQKKDAKRALLLHTAVRVFAEKGYQATTVRDIVQAADVAIGTFYFYFPDKETLFLHLYDETADFLLQSLRQAAQSHTSLPQQIRAIVQAYVNIALYEPAIIYLLLLGAGGSLPTLLSRRAKFREGLVAVWQRPLDKAVDGELLPAQNTRRLAEALAGGCDEVVWHWLTQPRREVEATAVVEDLTLFSLRAMGYTPPPT
jgi:AcrR family transcriptional regulator